MSHTMSPLTRRSFIHGGARLSLALAALLASRQAPHVAAGKKKKPKQLSVAERTDIQRESCELYGGQLAVLDGPNGGNTTECKGGEDDGMTCINTKKASKCSQARTQEPTKPGGGGAVPPSGGNEDPTDPSSPVTDPAAPPAGGNEQPSDGGSQAGGGAAVDPSGGVEQPSDGGGVTITAYDGGKDGQAKRHGTRRRQGRGKRRKA